MKAHLLLSVVFALILLACEAKDQTKPKPKQAPKKHYCRCPGVSSKTALLGGCPQESQNIISNGGGEIEGDHKVPSWKAGFGNVRVAQYGGERLCDNTPYSECDAPGLDIASKIRGGGAYIVGTCGHTNDTFFQDIYVGCLGRQIDRRLVVADFQGFLGGCLSDSSQALMGFYTAPPHGRHPLGPLSKIGPVFSSHREGLTTLLKRVAPSAVVPTGTRWIRITVRISEGTGFVDNLALTLSPR